MKYEPGPTKIHVDGQNYEVDCVIIEDEMLSQMKGERVKIREATIQDYHLTFPSDHNPVTQVTLSNVVINHPNGIVHLPNSVTFWGNFHFFKTSPSVGSKIKMDAQVNVSGFVYDEIIDEIPGDDDTPAYARTAPIYREVSSLSEVSPISIIEIGIGETYEAKYQRAIKNRL